jgi:CRISPR-associated endonuclease/helicase Cas3
MPDFADFFRKATGYGPYPYQERFAEANPLPHLLRAPTGAGKTDAAVVGWLWRWVSKISDTPRRLVYCLPMRVLVEQTQSKAKEWIKKLELDIPVHVLMGGVEAKKWYLHPEKPAILIGTQDMLLSRALNRGYAASRFHWPIDFGLLNNDCLWVFDEPQLMASGVSTSAQLAGLREQQTFGTFGPSLSVWMSATLEPGWLETVDFRGKFPGKPLELDEADYDTKRPLNDRMTAKKTLAPLGIRLTKDADEKEANAVATKVLAKHLEAPTTQTLVVLNTVKRAKKVYEALAALRNKPDSLKLLLVHSRFRPFEREGSKKRDGKKEREGLNDKLQSSGEAAADRIIVATQVVEAGVDISARTLVTELAPWASIVQRIGRCNRTGGKQNDSPGRVFWIDIDEEKQALPYEPAELVKARERMDELNGKDVSPKSLSPYKLDPDFQHKHIARRRDVLDFFDTSPDLSGNDIDVSRFVRGDDPETDVQVFWRAINTANLKEQNSPARAELCSVPVGEARNFLTRIANKKSLSGYVWDHIDKKWRKLKPAQVRPGLVILLPESAGGYTPDIGWNLEATFPVVPLTPSDEKPESTEDDPLSTGPPFTITEHTDHVCAELELLLGALSSLVEEWSRVLRQAARWHDVGKAHWAFQKGMHTANPALSLDKLWAKSGVKKRLRHGRKFFRHELASSLAARQHKLPFEAVYLIGAHHGKVRLSIRALPGEKPPTEIDMPFALGVHHEDKLPKVDCGGSVFCPDTELDLTPMKLGGESSWTANALSLLDKLGPFRLAYLEALLRAADQRASEKEATNAGN